MCCTGVPSLSRLSISPHFPLWGGGRWSDLYTPNSVLLLLIVCERPGHQVDFTLRVMDPLAEYLPIGESPSCHLPSVGLR